MPKNVKMNDEMSKNVCHAEKIESMTMNNDCKDVKFVWNDWKMKDEQKMKDEVIEWMVKDDEKFEIAEMSDVSGKNEVNDKNELKVVNLSVVKLNAKPEERHAKNNVWIVNYREEKMNDVRIELILAQRLNDV